MPFIDTRTNVRISAEKEEILKQRLGDAIAAFPGKSEYWLMLNFSDSSRMWFRGYNNVPTAMVEVKIFGTASEESCLKMTQELTKIFREELSIDPERLYINYTFSEYWGWNGENF